MSLGNQLNGVRLVDEGLRARFKAAYPDVEVQPLSPPRASAMEIDSNANQARSPFAPESKSMPSQLVEPAVSGPAFTSVEKPMATDVDIVSWMAILFYMSGRFVFACSFLKSSLVEILALYMFCLFCLGCV